MEYVAVAVAIAKVARRIAVVGGMNGAGFAGDIPRSGPIGAVGTVDGIGHVL